MRFDYENYDPKSYKIGGLECFSELVQSGVKKIALSGAVEKKDYEEMNALIAEITKAYGIKYHAEYNLVKNLIVEDDYIHDKYVFMLYADDLVIEKYKELKKKEDEYILSGSYDSQKRKEINAGLCRLLSYPEEKIEKYDEKK